MTTTEQIQRLLGVTVTEKDRKRLEPHLSGWTHLNEMFLLGGPSMEDDIRRMIVIELNTKRREMMLTKLVARLKSLERDQLNALINQVIHEH